jgi:transcriptional regulator with PAS, ATPase and Fis domain
MMESEREAIWEDRSEGGYLRVPWGNRGPEEKSVLFLYGNRKMAQLMEVVSHLAKTDVMVFIQGESGVGKELVARTIHSRSGRKGKPFIKVNCAALGEQVLERELFGCERGPDGGEPGGFELANGGTLFLDEIAEINLSLQAKLLQFLQDGDFSRVGGRRDIKVDVRLLVSTRRNLEEYVRAGRFREDLFCRLSIVKIHIPPLRERREEVLILTRYFLGKYGHRHGTLAPPLSQDAKKLLRRHEWPGNVRELECLCERLVILGDEEVIKKDLNRHPFQGLFVFQKELEKFRYHGTTVSGGKDKNVWNRA